MAAQLGIRKRSEAWLKRKRLRSINIEGNDGGLVSVDEAKIRVKSLIVARSQAIIGCGSDGISIEAKLMT